MSDRRIYSRKVVGWLAVPLLLVAAGVTWILLDPGFRSAETPSQLSSDVPRDEFDRRVRAYILDNPEVIVEAMQRLQARQRAAEAGEVAAAIEARAEEIFRDPATPVGGNPDGDTTLVEFFDYNCPYCRRVAPVMAEAEAADPRLRIVYKEFPILGADSLFAAKAALAAQLQDRYLAFHEALMRTDSAVDPDLVLSVAAEVGLDMERLKTDMDDPAVSDAIDRNLELARALRITGTPGFIAGSQVLRGATDLANLQTFIDQARPEK